MERMPCSDPHRTRLFHRPLTYYSTKDILSEMAWMASFKNETFVWISKGFRTAPMNITINITDGRFRVSSRIWSIKGEEYAYKVFKVYISDQVEAGGQDGLEAGTSIWAEPFWRPNSKRTIFQTHTLYGLTRACEERDNPFDMPV